MESLLAEIRAVKSTVKAFEAKVEKNKIHLLNEISKTKDTIITQLCKENKELKKSV